MKLETNVYTRSAKVSRKEIVCSKLLLLGMTETKKWRRPPFKKSYLTKSSYYLARTFTVK